MTTNTATNLSSNTNSADDDGEDSKIPANIRRATAWRRRVSQIERDMYFLKRWEKNDTDDGDVNKLVMLVEEVAQKMEEVAERYEYLPPEVMLIRRGPVRPDFSPGSMVQVKEKFRDIYAAMTADVMNMRVVSRRDTHILVESTEGQRFFVAAKELEATQG